MSVQDIEIDPAEIESILANFPRVDLEQGIIVLHEALGEFLDESTGNDVDRLKEAVLSGLGALMSVHAHLIEEKK